jgi:ribosomal protein S14
MGLGVPSSRHGQAAKLPATYAGALGRKPLNVKYLKRRFSDAPFLLSFASRRKVGRDAGLSGRVRFASTLARAFADLERLAQIDSTPVHRPWGGLSDVRPKKLTPSQHRRKYSREYFRQACLVEPRSLVRSFSVCWKKFRQATLLDMSRSCVAARKVAVARQLLEQDAADYSERCGQHISPEQLLELRRLENAARRSRRR